MAKLNLATATAVLSLWIVPALTQAVTSSIVTLHLGPLGPGDPATKTLHASIITAGPTATTYFVACPTETDPYDCDLVYGVRWIEGPSTYINDFQVGPATSVVSVRENCVVENRATGTCTNFQATGDGTSWTTMMNATVTLEPELFTPFYRTVTVTAGFAYAGADSVAEASPTGKPVASAQPTAGTSTEAGSTGTTAALTSPGSTGSSSPSSTAPPSSSSSTGGMPRITGNSMVAGVAAVFGGVLLI